jgi:hypothetical protein
MAGWLECLKKIGKVEAHLNVKLGEAFAPVTKHSKIGPLRQRRHEWRAAARKAAEAHEQENVENDVAKGAPNGLNKNTENNTENVCWDRKGYKMKSALTISILMIL